MNSPLESACDGSRQAGAFVDDGDFGVGNHRAGRVGDGAENGAADGCAAAATGVQARASASARRVRRSDPGHFETARPVMCVLQPMKRGSTPPWGTSEAVAV